MPQGSEGELVCCLLPCCSPGLVPHFVEGLPSHYRLQEAIGKLDTMHALHSRDRLLSSVQVAVMVGLYPVKTVVLLTARDVLAV